MKTALRIVVAVSLAVLLPTALLAPRGPRGFQGGGFGGQDPFGGPVGGPGDFWSRAWRFWTGRSPAAPEDLALAVRAGLVRAAWAALPE